MTIGIDITPLLFQGSGVADYTYNLVKNLLLIDKKNQYKLLFTSPRINKSFPFLEEFKKMGAKIYRYPLPFVFFQICWEKLDVVPVEWLIGPIDVFYASDFLRPPSTVRTVTTVHDLIWKIHPGYHEDFIVKTHDKKLSKTIQYRDTVVVDSQTTKNDLLKYFPRVNQKKIHVIYPGIGEEFKPPDQRPKRSLSDKPYILYVGAIEPRKNLLTAIEVFRELIKDKYFSDFEFLIAGMAGWRKNQVTDEVKNLRLEGRVKFLGYVKDQDLPGLYSKAKLTVYLSSYEGFGLPPLESLACGTPVLAGDNSSMKETIDRQFLVDVFDKKEVLKKMKFLLKSAAVVDSLKVREKFSWHSAAEQLLRLWQ
ncbi:glycosyltransferase family 4 protein [Patescibacteria group bacterium]|nr:glycosyltransferase family 4 protein [Patescibacteria group bacterium]